MTSPNDDSLRFVCPRCMAMLKTRASQAGKRRRCPRCQLLLEVPRQSRSDAKGEDYSLSLETEALPTVQPTHIPVLCMKCRTRVYAAADQVGQKIVCPDCGTLLVVPPAAIPVKTAVVPADGEGYPLCEEVQPPPPPRGRKASGPDFVAVLCSLCHTRMHARLDEVGSSLTCPDCGTKTIVPPPPPAAHKVETSPEVAAGYGLDGWGEWTPPPVSRAEPPPPPVEEPAEPIDAGAYAPRPRGIELKLSERPTLPSWPFWNGTFTFPLTRGARGFVIVLMLGALLPCGMAVQSVELSKIPSEGTWIGSLALGGSAAILTVMWLTLASACALAIVRDTANGCEEIRDWPDLNFLEWVLEPLYIFNAYCVSMLPGILYARLTGSEFLDETPITLACMFLIFPIALLSMLERGTAIGAISWAVYRTFWTAWRGWLGFFLAAAVLMTAAFFTLAAAVWAGPLWGTIAGFFTLVFVWMVYFRMLGRLAWYCSEHSGREEPAEDDSREKGRTGLRPFAG